MKKIEKLEIDTEVYDRKGILVKINELVDRVNNLSEGKCWAGDTGVARRKFPRPRYLPHDKEH